MTEIATPSTGDKAKDLETLERFARNDELISANQCPNGHGEMFKASESMSECTECGFVHSVSRIYV